MCRSKDDGGRRCPGHGASSTRAAVAERQRRCRARKAETMAAAAAQGARSVTTPTAHPEPQFELVGPAPLDPGNATDAWRRVQAGGVAAASRNDLIAAWHAADTAMDRQEIQRELRERADEVGRQASRDARSVDGTLTDQRVARIQGAIEAAAAQQRPRDWLPLAQVRAEIQAALPEVPRAEVDAVLRRMSRAKQLHLVPDSNRKMHTLADQEAAIWIGDEPNHLIAFER
jgi:hypothetical protein